MTGSVRRRLLCLLLLVLGPCPLYGQEESSGVYTYRETTGDLITPFSWKVEEKGSQRIVSVYENKKSFVNTCSADGATLEWRLQDPDKENDVIASRQGNVLTIAGLRHGANYERTVELDDRPWYQPLSYSLRQFLGSGRDSMSFWMVRADTIDVVALQVEKKGEEEVAVNGKNFPALKVEVRPEGFYSHFWHGTYWYRKSDKLFLMYRSIQGMPGSAETVVELIAEPDPPAKKG